MDHSGVKISEFLHQRDRGHWGPPARKAFVAQGAQADNIQVAVFVGWVGGGVYHDLMPALAQVTSQRSHRSGNPALSLDKGIGR